MSQDLSSNAADREARQVRNRTNPQFKLVRRRHPTAMPERAFYTEFMGSFGSKSKPNHRNVDEFFSRK
jgi:hypothetical protein